MGKHRFQAHQQGFGTAPVDDLLAHVSSELPKIQADAGVTQLISKWNEPELQKHAGAEKVDVTLKLLDAFHPNERQRNYVRDGWNLTGDAFDHQIVTIFNEITKWILSFVGKK